MDADSSLAHSVRSTSGNMNEVVEANSLLYGQEKDAFGETGYQGVDRRADANRNVRRHVAYDHEHIKRRLNGLSP